MPRESTDLSNYNYDTWLSKNKKENELRQRNAERREAHKKDMSGWHFGIDTKPVKVKDMQEYKHELSKRGLGIKDEAGPNSQARKDLPWKQR